MTDMTMCGRAGGNWRLRFKRGSQPCKPLSSRGLQGEKRESKLPSSSSYGKHGIADAGHRVAAPGAIRTRW